MNQIGPKQRLATRLAFLSAGLCMSAWAPLVPYAKARLGLNEGSLGLLLLCLGVGSLLAMPLTGVLAARLGCRRVILTAGALTCLLLPCLALADSPLQLGIALFVFGAAIGTLDVAMNVQAVMVEKASGGALMSGFHGLFSVGGFVGAGGMALLLWGGLSPFWSSVTAVAFVALVLVVAAPHLLREPEQSDRDALFVLPHGAVIFIGVLCFIVFLVEGAILDWSALFLTAARGLSASQGGLGYAAFAIAMTAGRLTGDRIVKRFGGKRVLLLGGLCAAGGFFLAVSAATAAIALLGFVLIGLGASNIVPILFSAAGNQAAMPAGLAIAAITTLGYAGILAGPALIGFVAHATSLNVAFALLGCALLLVAASAHLGAASKNAA
ncbi:major Facilitator Superfamily protein [Collimonas arenae]|uniref:Major Facilitator Superfamily protein n=1 Tax=Collimonas arenae TaxID=279058 RepID=A0A127QGN6_9BURK|nr:MFS transporter [Collimonas arenae]AMP09136.1 major Facilitator Superfamily protein [Collimonas arenae]